jgi:phosphoglycolate phosphatase-like HAD superfamily hydrolase
MPARRPAAGAQTHRPTPIRAILFDKDGTLFDFRKTWLAAYGGAAAELAEVAGLGPWFVDALLARHGYDPASDTFTAESPLLWATTRDQAALWSAEPELAAIGDLEQRLERHFSDLDAYPPVPVTDLVRLFERLRARLEARDRHHGRHRRDGSDARPPRGTRTDRFPDRL